MKKIKINSTDNYQLSLHIFDAKKPKAVIQIIHGMEEHQGRYEEFAHTLSKYGFIVVTSDIRGHGVEEKNLGYFKDKKGYLQVIEDQVKIRQYIEENYRGTPVVLFGHSMGTIISRVLLQKHSDKYCKAIFSGAPNYQAAVGAGKLISSLIKTFKGPKYDSKLLQSMTTDSFNKAIKNPKTKLDWLSYNEENINKYIEDEYCGFNFTASAYNDLFHLMGKMHKSSKYKNINKELEILFISGKEDPCTGGDKGLNSSIKTLKKAGFSHIERIDYDGMRHEILNEKENEKVIKDIIQFIEKETHK